MNKLFIIFTMLIISTSAFAGFSSKLAKAVDQKITEGQAFISALEENKEANSDWLLSRIRMLSYVLFKFEIPFLEVKVMPMVEGRWVKRHEGRTLYRPDGV